ncbi:MAG: BMP family ABC transporter substrate-binding protein [Treponema sp.]|nr:BMP family ABC transporter substrate-binding protein [Treponema sp.]
MKKQCRVSLFPLMLLLLLCALASCSNDGDSGGGGETETEKISEKLVIVFHLPAGLGDNSYTDILAYGIHKAAFENNLLVYDVSPDDWDDAQVKIQKVFSSYRELIGAEENADIPVLFVFASESYLPVLESDEIAESIAASTEPFTYLLFESEETEVPYLSTVYMPLYGASYLAGTAAKTLLSAKENPRVISLLANDFMQPLIDALNGFSVGYGSSGSTSYIYNYFATTTEEVEEMRNATFVAESINGEADTTGFNSEDTAYKIAYNNSFNTFDLYFPICGGSIHGLLRYNREQGASSFYTVGMDSDMSAYSPQVPFSVVKHIDKAAEKCIAQWLAEGKIEHYQRLGLGEGYTELVVSEGYESLSAVVQEHLSEAIEKEHAYYEN